MGYDPICNYLDNLDIPISSNHLFWYSFLNYILIYWHLHSTKPSDQN
ncbi:hypothetical protein ZPR_4590 [Zunongwangia profunda SM-A87]|uniref:Uncharacterized protein n=1 Tax=Zunongwangia profunda (strain DSM 18752 / CCTCC AB 206139 / SM-A87) TaxID=655815 RepID=D5BDI4_ZUNPS|nr:hypothetical protein ZPR_4590 [Zunongwangia profunda SM-A87]